MITVLCSAESNPSCKKITSHNIYAANVSESTIQNEPPSEWKKACKGRKTFVQSPLKDRGWHILPQGHAKEIEEEKKAEREAICVRKQQWFLDKQNGLRRACISDQILWQHNKCAKNYSTIFTNYPHGHNCLIIVLVPKGSHINTSKESFWSLSLWPLGP